MSPVTGNAIVIAYPGQVRRTASMAGLPSSTRTGGNFSVFDPLDLDSSDFRNSGGGPKKRRRLTHLSPDEKLLRRKLKNRVAAQTARDRKRAQMADLEEKLAILEEENELLKLQNFSLKETSNRLAKENAALVCQLADQQLVTTETDSEPKRSAEGAGSESAAVRDAVHRYDNCQPDNFLGLLQELVEESKCEWPQIQTTTSLPQASPGHRSSAPRTVGMTSTELETLNELISIDHVYVKPQHLHVGKDGQQKATNALRAELLTNTDISPQKNYPVGLSQSKTGHSSDITCDSFSPIPHRTPSFTKLSHECVGFAPSPVLSSSSSLSSSQQDIHSNYSTLFACSDVEALAFPPSCDFCEPESGLTKQNSHDVSAGFNVPQAAEQTTTVSENEQIATDLFHEIYEHYLNMKDSCCSDSIAESDAGICTDFDAVSPENSGESLHDFMWHEASFADLFPDLH